MDPIFTQTFWRDGKQYKVEVAFDDEAIMENQAKFKIKGAVREEGSKDWREISFDAALDWERRVIVLKHEGEGLFSREISLEIPLPDLKDLWRGEIEDTALNEISAAAAERAIHLIPGDPLLGCLIKGVTSTVLGQMIRCWPQVKRVEQWKQKAYAMARCLKGHSWQMLGRFLWRFGKCAGTAGVF